MSESLVTFSGTLMREYSSLANKTHQCNSMNTEKLFSYRTLQYEAEQLTNFGRKLAGTINTLSKLKLSELKITDSDVIATSGEDVHLIFAGLDY
jgi:hypothetical protein